MKYRVYGIWTGSKFLGEFEANSEEGAIDMAAESEANYVGLCHQCAHELEVDEPFAQEFQVEVDE